MIIIFEYFRIVGMVLDFVGFIVLACAAIKARANEDRAEKAQQVGDIFKHAAEVGEDLSRDGKNEAPKQPAYDRERAAKQYRVAEQELDSRKRIVRGAELIAFPLVAIGAALQLIAELGQL